MAREIDIRIQGLSSIEMVERLRKGKTNTWIGDYHIDECKRFKGTETDAEKLIEKIEKDANNNYHMWRSCQ